MAILASAKEFHQHSRCSLLPALFFRPANPEWALLSLISVVGLVPLAITVQPLSEELL
jgi:hypothetical protein